MSFAIEGRSYRLLSSANSDAPFVSHKGHISSFNMADARESVDTAVFTREDRIRQLAEIDKVGIADVAAVQAVVY